LWGFAPVSITSGQIGPKLLSLDYVDFIVDFCGILLYNKFIKWDSGHLSIAGDEKRRPVILLNGACL